MTLARWFAVLAAVWLAGTGVSIAVRAASHETPVDGSVQYALENFVSGTSTSTVIRGTAVSVTPLRTWRSVTGHFCRAYEITISAPDSEPTTEENIRCRAENGLWLPVQAE